MHGCSAGDEYLLRLAGSGQVLPTVFLQQEKGAQACAQLSQTSIVNGVS
jgi:hypothetical protein